MTDFKLEDYQKTQETREKNSTRIEEEGLKNILKYFDRIHDKLFVFNNILIAGIIGKSICENS